MLPVFQNAQDVTVSVDFPMDGPSVINPASVDCEVLDETGSVVFALQTLSPDDLVGSKATFTIDRTLNIIPDGASRTLRSVRFFFKKADGSAQSVITRYVLELIDTLTVMGNSFQTYETALITRFDMPALDGWDSAAERDQIAALVTSHDRLCRLTYKYRISQEALEWDSIRGLYGLYWYVTDMRLRGMDDWNQFPDDFKTALMRSQIYEADTILSGDPIGDKRAQGIVSETTGEAKMFFTNKPPLRHPVGMAALNVLSPYIYRNNRITRG